MNEQNESDDRSPEPWDSFITRSSIIESRLSRAAKLTYTVLSYHANQTTHTAFPSIATIAREGSMGKRMVFYALKELRKAGYLKYRKRYRPDGGLTSNLYTILDARTKETDDSSLLEASSWPQPLPPSTIEHPSASPCTSSYHLSCTTLLQTTPTELDLVSKNNPEESDLALDLDLDIKNYPEELEKDTDKNQYRATESLGSMFRKAVKEQESLPRETPPEKEESLPSWMPTMHKKPLEDKEALSLRLPFPSRKNHEERDCLPPKMPTPPTKTPEEKDSRHRGMPPLHDSLEARIEAKCLQELGPSGYNGTAIGKERSCVRRLALLFRKEALRYLGHEPTEEEAADRGRMFFSAFRYLTKNDRWISSLRWYPSDIWMVAKRVLVRMGAV